MTSLACVSYMAVPDALCVIFACPVVTIGLSAVLLRDKLNAAKIVAGGLLLLGVVLVCKPEFLFNSVIPQTDDSSTVLIQTAWKTQVTQCSVNIILLGHCCQHVPDIITQT